MATKFQQWFISLATGLMLSVLSISPAIADDKAGGGKNGNQKLFDTLTEIINQGADLYNGGDQSGCYYLFKGALTALRIQLDNRPELQKAIDEGMAKADKQRLLRSRAFTLRNLLGDIRAKVNPNPKKVDAKEEEKKEKPKKPDKSKADDKKKEDVKKPDDKKKPDNKKKDDKKPDDKKNDEPKSDS